MQKFIAILLSGAAAAGTSKEVEAVELNSAHITTLPLPPKRKCTSTELAAETDETRVLSLSELQRLVLLEQLKLIKMQQKGIENKRERESFCTSLEEFFLLFLFY